MIWASAFKHKSDHRFFVGTEFFSESICLENKRHLPKFIEQEFAIYSAQKNLCCNKKKLSGFSGSTLLQSWAKIPVLTSAAGSDRRQGKALTSALQGWRPRWLCTLHNGLSVRRTRGRECVLGGFSWFTVPPGTQKKPVLASPAVEYLPPPRAGAPHTGENPEDPAAGLCWSLHHWAANGFQGKKKKILEKVHDLSLNQDLHLACSLQLPAYVVNSILGR